MSNRAQRRSGVWTPFERAKAIPLTEAQIAFIAGDFGIGIDEARVIAREREADEIWKNSRYQVAIIRDIAPRIGSLAWPVLHHLSIKRLDREPIHDWRDMQRIKNELIGPEHEAVELYPAESRLVDTVNQFHLWVIAERGRRFPFGFTDRKVIDKASCGAGAQRPFDKSQP